MDERLRRAVLGLDDKRSAVEGSTTGHAYHWPNGIVPYTFDESLSKFNFLAHFIFGKLLFTGIWYPLLLLHAFLKCLSQVSQPSHISKAETLANLFPHSLTSLLSILIRHFCFVSPEM